MPRRPCVRTVQRSLRNPMTCTTLVTPKPTPPHVRQLEAHVFKLVLVIVTLPIFSLLTLPENVLVASHQHSRKVYLML
ncbi:hypothetical protein MTO96_045898 [Rhipicephalus appendiculatus]